MFTIYVLQDEKGDQKVTIFKSRTPRYHQFGRLREADFWRCHGALGDWGGHIWLHDFDFGGWKEGMIGVTLLKIIHISPPSPYGWVQDYNERSLEGINVVEVFICLSYDMLILKAMIQHSIHR